MSTKKLKVLNSQGEEIKLDQREKKVATSIERAVNELGFEISVTTMTQIQKKIVEQRFFEIPPADYIPVRVGEGAWATQLTTYRQYALGDDFATGIINTGSNNSQMAQTDVGIDAVNVPVINWAKGIGWTLFELQQATLSGNWDLITAKEMSRKKNWDLGIQKVAFLGIGNTPGLYTMTGVTVNTTLITKKIADMTATELSAFCKGVLDAYRTNCARTAWPTHFIIPESDFLGLAIPSSADFPLKSKLQVLTETFATMTKKPGFQILPCAYGDNLYSGLGVQKYVLHNYDEETLRMDIPVDYNNTLANSNNSFSFQNVGYGQFTGCYAYRPTEVLYFTY